MKRYLVFFALALGMGLPFRAYVKGVVNDAFADRTPILGPNIEDITLEKAPNLDASRETGEPRHGDQPGGASVWWKWTAPRAGLLIVDLSGSTFDTLLGI